MQDEELNKALKCLSNQYRRDILETLLTDYKVVIKSENKQMGQLFHVHIPKLENFGFVTATHMPGEIIIERGDRWDEFEQLVRIIKTYRQTR